MPGDHLSRRGVANPLIAAYPELTPSRWRRTYGGEQPPAVLQMDLSEFLVGQRRRSQMALLRSHLLKGTISFSHLLRYIYPERLQGFIDVLYEVGVSLII